MLHIRYGVGRLATGARCLPGTRIRRRQASLGGGAETDLLHAAAGEATGAVDR